MLPRAWIIAAAQISIRPERKGKERKGKAHSACVTLFVLVSRITACCEQFYMTLGI
jgi:hypothetical protein